MIKCKIKKSQWLRGTGNGVLRDQVGKQCCIGFLCKVLGATNKLMLGHATMGLLAFTIDKKLSPLQEFYFDGHEGTLERAYEINDDKYITDSTRMQDLRDLGKDMGVQFTFVP